MPKKKPSSQKPLIHGNKVVVANKIKNLTIYEGIKPVLAGDLLNACVSQVENTILDVGRKFNPDLYVHRKIETEINEFIESPLKDLSPNCYLIVAPAGSGKTNLVCNLARTHATHRPVLLLLGGNVYLDKRSGLLGTFKSELQDAKSEISFRSSADCLHTIDRLGKELDSDSLIFLDAINEYEHPVEMRKAIEHLIKMTRGKRIKLVVTCRDYYWGLFKGLFWKEATINELPEEVDSDTDSGEEDADFSRFAKNEFEKAFNLYLKFYEIIGRPVGKAAEQCRHPLLLRFFCEAYRGEEIGEPEDIRLKELFDRYWKKKLESIAERMVRQGDERLLEGLAQEIGTYLVKIAKHMLHHNVRALSIENLSKITDRNKSHIDPRSLYGRIRDEFIILEEKERGKGRHKFLQVAFVYEEFMEYVMARSLIVEWDKEDCDDSEILAEIEALFKKYDSFTQIFGVIVYLALILKADRNLALWSLLANRGGHWQEIIFEAVRKLPEDQLDTGVFDALYEMLSKGEQAIQIQVLDTLKIKRIGELAPSNLVNLVSKSVVHQQESIARRAVLALAIMPCCMDLHWIKEALIHSSKAVRLNAVNALLKLKDARTIEPLIDALKSDTDVGSGVAKALGKIGEPAVNPLLNALKDNDWRVRWGVAEALGKIGNKRAIDPLIAVLKDTKASVRTRAAEALGKIGNKRAVDPLIDALKDKVSDVRRGAALALGEIGEKRAVTPLVTALKDTDWDVRKGAAEALGILNWKPTNDRYNGLYLMASRDWESIVNLGDPAIALLIAALKDTDWDDKDGPAEALAKIGDPAIAPLIAAFKDTDWPFRAYVAKVLRKIGEPAVVPLIAALRDSSDDVREGAARALGKIADQRAVDPLIDTLKDTHYEVQYHAVKALGEIADQRAVDPLITALKYKGSRRREGAAEALGEIADQRAVDPLIAALKDTIWYVKRRAALALGKIGDKRAVDPLIDALKNNTDVRSDVAKALGKIGEPAVNPLLNALKDNDWRVRWGVAEALGKIGNKRAVDPLIAVLKDTKASVRRRAAEALGKIGDKRSVDPLIAVLKDTEASVRKRAALALVAIGEPAVVPLIAALKDSDRGFRKHVAEALAKLGGIAMEPLIAALKDPNVNVQEVAIRLLGEIGEPAVEPLITALKDSDRGFRKHVAEALVKLGGIAMEPLIAALKDTDRNVRWGATEALERLKDKRAVEPLIAALKDSDVNVRRYAVEALLKIGTPDALEVVLDHETKK